MTRPGAVTFKGTPLTLVGEEVKVGQKAPDFTLLRYADGGMKPVKLSDFLGKPLLVSVVPSLDTGVCQIQTKKFNERLGELAGQAAALTVSLDLPFAQNRFCAAENIVNLQWGSDYQNRDFGKSYGLLIDELKVLARALIVIDAAGVVTHYQLVKEVASEPDYDAALTALKAAA